MFVARVTGTEQVSRAVENFAVAVGRSLQEEIIGIARLVAVSLATSTQPYGNSKAAHETGKKRVETDIRNVFASPSSIYDTLDIKDEFSAGQFWRAFTEKNTSAMLEIMQREGLSITQITHTPARSLHESFRKSNGRVYIKKPRGLVLDSKSLKDYIRQRQKMVGFAKAGWAKAADDCGGHRGIPAWASSKHPSAPGRALITRDVKRPHVVLINDVRYVSDILPQPQINTAIEIAYERAMKRYSTALRKQARNLFRRAS